MVPAFRKPLTLVGDGMRSTLSYEAIYNVRREAMGNATAAANSSWPSKENKP